MATTTDRSAQELLRSAARDIEAALSRLAPASTTARSAVCGTSTTGT